MNFDLTKETGLDPKNHALYRKLRTGLYMIALFFALVLAYLILFPSKNFTFSFLTPDSSKNDLIEPRLEDGSFPGSGRLESPAPLLFDAVATANYSTAQISLTLAKSSAKPKNASLKVRKSYQAFLYPEGEPIGFKDGTLLKNGQDYFIVSGQKIRRFADEKTFLDLGFKEEVFLEVDKEELKYNPEGEIIISYPDHSLFRVGGVYYILKDGTLNPFVSKKAYLTQYDAIQAIPKDEDFLKNYSLAQKPVGFADGSLISYGESAFVVSGEFILPIDSPETFVEKGYLWSDLTAVSGGELSIYAKGKLQMLRSPHPDGIVYLTDENAKWYMVKDGEKHPLLSKKIARTWIKKDPIAVSEESLELKDACSLEKKTLNLRTYSCRFPVSELSRYRGKDYEFSLFGQKDMQIETLDATFTKEISRGNLKLSLLDLYNKLKMNYAQ